MTPNIRKWFMKHNDKDNANASATKSANPSSLEKPSSVTSKLEISGKQRKKMKGSVDVTPNKKLKSGLRKGVNKKSVDIDESDEDNVDNTDTKSHPKSSGVIITCKV